MHVGIYRALQEISSEDAQNFYKSNQFFHGKSATCFYNGIGGNKQGHLAEQSMTPMQWINSRNFAGLSTRSITSMNPNQHLTKGLFTPGSF